MTFVKITVFWFSTKPAISYTRC